ncbi:MAG: ATP-binding cassette domain-containing protein, partial [Gammaproteobacteria bacterium]
MKAPALPPLLLVNDLRFAFGRREVLRIERLEIPASGILALQGDNGSGKTTLLKLLSGLLVASGGAWQMGAQGLSPRDAARFCRGRHVYLHQAPYLFD